MFLLWESGFLQHNVRMVELDGTGVWGYEAAEDTTFLFSRGQSMSGLNGLRLLSVA